MLLLHWETPDAKTLGLGIGYSALALTGYLSQEPIPLKAKLEGKLSKEDFKRWYDDVSKEREDFDIIVKMKSFLDYDEVYVTIPLTLTTDSGKKLFNFTDVTKLDSLLYTEDVKMSIKLPLRGTQFVINNELITQEALCTKCPLNKQKINGICWLKVDTVECVLTAYTHMLSFEASMNAAANGKGVVITNYEDPDEVNGGLYYV